MILEIIDKMKENKENINVSIMLLILMLTIVKNGPFISYEISGNVYLLITVISTIFLSLFNVEKIVNMNIAIKKYIIRYILIVLFFIVFEIINIENLSDLKLSIYHLFNFFIPLLLFMIIFDNLKILKILIRKFMLIFNLILIFGFLYGILLLIFSNDVVKIDDIHYLKIDLFGTSSIYQQAHGVRMGKLSMRIGSIFGNPNTFGFNAAIAYSINLTMLLKDKVEDRSKYIIMIIITLLSFFLTKSRASILFVVFFTGSMIVQNLKFKDILKIDKRKLVRIIMSIILITVFIYFSLAKRFSLKLDRFNQWDSTLKIIKNNIITGNGLKGFLNKLSLIDSSHAHNSFLQVLAVSGIFGLFVFVLSIVFSFINTMKYKKNVKYEKNFNVKLLYNFIISFLLASIPYQMFEVLIYSDKWSILLYLIIIYLGIALHKFSSLEGIQNV